MKKDFKWLLYKAENCHKSIISVCKKNLLINLETKEITEKIKSKLIENK